MIAVTSLLWIWKGEQAGCWYFVTVPDEQSDEIKAHGFANPRGFNSVKVEAHRAGVANLRLPAQQRRLCSSAEG